VGGVHDKEKIRGQAARRGQHEATEESNWQENYAFYGWDADRSCGFYLHLQRVAADGLLDIRVGAGVDGELTATSAKRRETTVSSFPGSPSTYRSLRTDDGTVPAAFGRFEAVNESTPPVRPCSTTPTSTTPNASPTGHPGHRADPPACGSTPPNYTPDNPKTRPNETANDY